MTAAWQQTAFKGCVILATANSWKYSHFVLCVPPFVGPFIALHFTKLQMHFGAQIKHMYTFMRAINVEAVGGHATKSKAIFFPFVHV